MKESFLDMISTHQGLIYRVVKLYRTHPADQEDLFQEIVLQLWKSYAQFRGEAKVSTWMYRIALNTALASFRKKRAPVEYPGDLPAGVADNGAPESEQQTRLLEAIRQLSPAERAIISLYFEGYAHREIGEIIGITENNVGVRMNRIKKKLKKRLT
ncbi:MAG: sigma-70 family RNA polymerase sigma factor [Bacteroidota bacterium]